MADATFPLATFNQATVDSNGVATTVGAGPTRYGERWEDIRYSISLTEGRGKCKVYRDYVGPTRQIDVTSSGDDDTSENATLTLKSGEKLIAQWTEATPGAIAIITFDGTIKIRRS